MGSLFGVKQNTNSLFKADDSPQSRAEVHNTRSHTSTLPKMFNGVYRKQITEVNHIEQPGLQKENNYLPHLTHICTSSSLFNFLIFLLLVNRVLSCSMICRYRHFKHVRSSSNSALTNEYPS